MELILKYFPNLSDKQKEQFEALYDLYLDWNSKINVISRKDIEELYVRHVLHSLGIAKVHEFKAGAKVMDVGTGGGFPNSISDSISRNAVLFNRCNCEENKSGK